MASPLAEMVASRIRDMLTRAPDEPLPSTRTLARICGASRPTVLKAISILGREGKVRVRQRRRMARADQPVTRSVAAEAETDRSAGRIAAVVRARIRDGVYPVGTPLPKRYALARDLGAAPHTVGKAYHQLIATGYAHRRGRSWIAGSRRAFGPLRGSRSAVQRLGSAPTIVILGKAWYSWDSVCRSERTFRFGESFMEQARQVGHRLVRTASIVPPREIAPFIEGGKHGVSRLVHKLGSLYEGALIVGKRGDIRGLSEWIDLFVGFRRPVVWLDAAEEGIEAEGSWKGSFVRTHPSHELSVRFAAEVLGALRHRRVAYPYAEHVGWQLDRLALLRAEAKRQGIEIQDIAVPRLDRPDPERLAAYLGAVYDHALPLVKRSFAEFGSTRAEAIAGFLRYLPQLARQRGPRNAQFHDPARIVRTSLYLGPVVQQKGITAVCAPNDELGGFYLGWLTRNGYRVPRDMSLLSFDNSPNQPYYPLTTIDPGFGSLGYSSFHRIAGTFGQGAGVGDEIVSEPALADNGSLARPAATN